MGHPMNVSPTESTTAAEPTASAHLRAATATAHTRAERSAFQRALISGRLPLERYVAFLHAMRDIWQALEEVAPRVSTGAARAMLLEPQRFRAHDIDRDLVHLRGLLPTAVSPENNAAANAFVARIHALANANPSALLGVLYVLEGSTNGGRYIARAMRRAYGLVDDQGVAFQDPYGDAQPERWAEWKAALDSMVSVGKVAALVDVAVETFDAVAQIGDSVLRDAPPAI
ncbi:MAG: biliverdin-producing heme oxygenase [Gemmatimonadaceae bacterium]|nr:biliverdin-producing heme oxygenase [Gemmatimonadaceae bacterium]